MKLLWRRLRKIAEDLVGRKVIIMGTTGMSDNDLVAVVGVQEGVVKILLNLNRAKSEDEVLSAIAHELAHITTDCADHDDHFSLEWKRLRIELMRRYQGGNKNAN